MCAPEPLPLSGSDDSEFEVAVLGNVRAALQSLEDDAKTAERVTTPEKQTWWKNKLKQSASRAEAAQSLVRPWESRRDAGSSSARQPSPAPLAAAAAPQPPAAGRNGVRFGESVGDKVASPVCRAAAALTESPDAVEGWRSPTAGSPGGSGSGRRSPRAKVASRVSTGYALPPLGNNHARKPSLSEILNLENKNSHLRGTLPLRNGDYDGAPKVRDSDYDGAPKLPHQLRAADEPSVRPAESRPRGRPKPSQSAPPPRAAQPSTDTPPRPRKISTSTAYTGGWQAGDDLELPRGREGARANRGPRLRARRLCIGRWLCRPAPSLAQ